MIKLKLVMVKQKVLKVRKNISKSLVFQNTTLKRIDDVDIDLLDFYLDSFKEKLGCDVFLNQINDGALSFYYQESLKSFIQEEITFLLENNKDEVHDFLLDNLLTLSVEKKLNDKNIKAFVLKNIYLHDDINSVLSEWQIFIFNHFFDKSYNDYFSSLNFDFYNDNYKSLSYLGKSEVEVILFITFWYVGLFHLKNPIKITEEEWEKIVNQFDFKSKLSKCYLDLKMFYALIYDGLQNNHFVDEETKKMMWDNLYGKFSVNFNHNPYQKQREYLISKLEEQNFDYKMMNFSQYCHFDSLNLKTSYCYDNLLFSKDKLLYAPHYNNVHVFDIDYPFNLTDELSMYDGQFVQSEFVADILFSANTLILFYKIASIKILFKNFLCMVNTEIAKSEYDMLSNLPVCILPFDFLIQNNMHKFHYFEYIDKLEKKLIKLQNKNKKEILNYLRSINEESMYKEFNKIVKKKKVKNVFQTLKSINLKFNNLNDEQKIIEMKIHHWKAIGKQLKKNIKHLDKQIKTQNINKNKIRFVEKENAGNFIRNLPYIFSQKYKK